MPTHAELTARCPSCRGARAFVYASRGNGVELEIFGVGVYIHEPTNDQIAAISKLQQVAGTWVCPDCGGSGKAIDQEQR